MTFDSPAHATPPAARFHPAFRGCQPIASERQPRRPFPFRFSSSPLVRLVPAVCLTRCAVTVLLLLLAVDNRPMTAPPPTSTLTPTPRPAADAPSAADAPNAAETTSA